MLAKVEMDADTARLLRRVAAHSGKGVSEFVQECVATHARNRGWLLQFNPGDPDESTAEDVYAVWVRATPQQRAVLLELLDKTPEQCAGLHAVMNARLSWQNTILDVLSGRRVAVRAWVPPACAAGFGLLAAVLLTVVVLWLR